MALALTQVFGLTATGLAPSGSARRRPASRTRCKETQSIAQPPAAADLADRIAHLDAPLPAFWIDLAGDRRVSPILAGQWFLAFTDTWTLDANAMARSPRSADPTRSRPSRSASSCAVRTRSSSSAVRTSPPSGVRSGRSLAPRVYGL